MRSIHLNSAKQPFSFAVLLLNCATVTLGGCSFKFSLGESTLDNSAVESSIKQEVARQIGIQVQSVTCPKDVKLGANTTFQCQVEVEQSDAFTVNVKQKDDQGNVDWKIPSELILLTRVEQEIQQGIEKQLDMKVSANCGGKVKVVPQGESFECQVTDPQGATHTAKVTATSNQGDIKWKL
jgi:hypothetical protein